MKNFVIANRICRLLNLNTRAEKHGEDDVVRADLNFETTIQVDDLIRMSATEATPEAVDRYRELLFLPTKGEELPRFREHNIRGIVFDREFENHRVVLDMQQQRVDFEPVKLCKFRAELDDDGLTLKLKFQMQIDPIGHLDLLASHINHSMTVHVEEPRQQDLVENAAKNEEPQTNNVVPIAGRTYPEALDGTASAQ